MHQKKRDGRGRDAGNAACLTDGFGPVPFELLARLHRQPVHLPIIQTSWKRERLLSLAPSHFVALALDIAFILGLNFDLLSDLIVNRGLKIFDQNRE